ncbi:peptidoglycan-binding protein LysM [Formosa sediminum]|uniref:Peptidoglycan-binding protein LysM n=1 Tax=Formosa sediminum TaxID=2594004 RepID=A0A516GLN7_9FLAO|nr:peptidoglycan-binding protein LysM [Formosa sediminum]QDO92442.1 peptidoglycan-binding protein LysM [Formosa sediminum]
MIKNIGSYLFVILAICSLAFYSFSSKETFKVGDSYLTEGLALNYNMVNDSVSHNNAKALKTDIASSFSPSLGKTYVGFKEALGFKESRGNYFTVNTLGYLGKYQFGKETLKIIGIHNPVQFLKNPELQEKAFLANAERNKWILRRDIKKYVGKKINGVVITESGILAAAHLSGPGNVKKYLRSHGSTSFSDAYGTTIEYYMKKFSGYDTSFVKPNKKAKVVKA